MRLATCLRLSLPLFSLLTVGWGAEGGKTLTLDEALSSVERTNLTVLLSKESVVQALEQISLARAAILPIVTGSATQRRTKSVPLTNTGATSARPTNRFEAILSGNITLMDFQRWSALGSAKLGGELARADYAAVQQSILASVAQSYFTHLRNLRRLEVLDANIQRAQSLLTLARNQLEAGIATQIDVTRAEAQLATAEQARLQQTTTNLQSELTLKRVIDLPIQQETRLEDFNLQRSDGKLLLFSEDKTTFEKRADYIRAQKAVEQAKVDVRTAKFERMPSLALTGTWGRGAPNYDDDKLPQWSVAGTLSVPIFDAFRSGSDRRLAQSRQRAQELRLHNLELQISAELRLAAQDASSRNAQIAVAEKNLNLGRQELQLARQRYSQGVADNREVVEAQNRLAVAEDNFVEAVFQYNLSRVELARARGDVRTVLGEKAP